MAKIYLGSGTTNSSGVASVTYTATGKGQLSVTAESGSLLSETYEVLDALFYDEALTDAKWNTNYVDVTVNRELVSGGTKLSYTATNGTKYCNTVIGATRNWFDPTKRYQIEFDFSFERDSTDSAVGIGIGTVGFNIHNLFSGSLSGDGHLKLITTGNTYQIYLNDVARGSPLTITGDGGFYFHVYRTGSITFKDLKIYSI